MSDTDRQGIGHIVAIRPGALGDTLLIFPTLALLRRAYPAARITLVARRDVLSLAHIWGLAGAVSPYDAPQWSALFAATPPLDSPLCTTLAGATIIAWLADRDGLVSANLRALGAHTIAIVPGRPREDIPTHAALQFAAPLSELGVPVPADTSLLYTALPPLRMPPTDTAVGALPAALVPQSPLSPQGEGPEERTPLVALHAGSGGAAKRWLPERFAALAGAIARLGPSPILIEGPQDGAITRAVLVEMEPLDIRQPAVAHDLDLLALARLLTDCVAYIGNDSGVSHLAGLLGLPTLALFGPTDPAIWSPLSPRTHVLRSPTGNLADLPVAPVAALLRDLLPHL